ncbi:diacylglycerol kinase family protein [Candidatus Falkowbacteria bacterium]|nr:diacylglycerol kinase family protein [Candidatus Falkowbacteria bacterium]
MKRFAKSLSHALRGFKVALQEEPNLRIHCVIGLLVILASIYFQITRVEFFFVAFAIVLVLVAEIINSIFERMLDMLKPGVNEYVKDMKDIMAAVVVIVVAFAIAIGVVVFVPYLNML